MGVFKWLSHPFCASPFFLSNFFQPVIARLYLYSALLTQALIRYRRIHRSGNARHTKNSHTPTTHTHIPTNFYDLSSPGARTTTEKWHPPRSLYVSAPTPPIPPFRANNNSKHHRRPRRHLPTPRKSFCDSAGGRRRHHHHHVPASENAPGPPVNENEWKVSRRRASSGN